MTKKKTTKPTEKGNLVKRYQLTIEEKQNIQNLESVLGILALERAGINDSLVRQMAMIQARAGVKYMDAPEGYERIVDFDHDNFELLVIDMLIEKQAETPGDAAIEAKN